MTKAVFDSNIFISSTVFGGKPRQIFEMAIEGKIKLYVSKEILEEVHEVLLRPKFKYPLEMISLFITEVQNIAETVIPREKINHIQNDPEDNIILECALQANVDFIVSGDAHLLNLKKYKTIQILNATDFLKKMSC